MQLLIRLFVANLAASLCIVKAEEIPDCYQCKDTDKCYVDEKKGTNLSKLNPSTWSTKVSRGQYAYISLYLQDSKAMTIENRFDLDGIVAIHYGSNTSLYKAPNEKTCKATAPIGASFQDITGIKYEYPDLRG